ncbi:MAG: type II secretion system GspH family protein [Magnetococcus sp. DMHC-1]|nr:type II secretion system protein [Magnetococcales bacterium]
MNKKICRGYSMIEMLIVVLVIGILSGISFTTFGNLSPSSGDAAANSVAGALVAAAANNRAKCEMGDAFTVVTTCALAQSLLQNVSASDFTVATGAATPPAGYMNCTVRHSRGSTTISVNVRSTTATCT